MAKCKTVECLDNFYRICTPGLRCFDTIGIVTCPRVDLYCLLRRERGGDFLGDSSISCNNLEY